MKLLPDYPQRVRRTNACLVCATAAFILVGVTFGATQAGPNFVVNSLADTADGSCDLSGQGTGNKDCTLREAIDAANSRGGGTIAFSVSGTITLGSVLPPLNSSMTIDGTGQSVTISGNDSVGIFQVYNKFQTVNFNALTIAHSSNNLGSIFVRYAWANITNCTFNDNYCNSPGGALCLKEYSHTVVANCTFYNNSAVYGGGIFLVGVPNGAPSDLHVYSSTFYNNHASFGTGQYHLAAADIYAGSATAEIRNTILVNTDNRGMNQEDNAQGLTYADTSDMFNVDIDAQSFNATQASAAQINLDTTLKDNGGPTKTLALLSGSVAINAGSNSAASAAPVNSKDQRGFARLTASDPNSDVGAYEYNAQEAPSLIVTTPADVVSAVDGLTSLREAVTYAQSLSGAQTITFAASLTGEMVTLSNPWDNSNPYNSSSALRVDGNLTIDGPTSAPGITLKVDDAAQLRHFVISSGGTLVLNNLTLRDGKALLSDNNGNFAFGGAVWNFGSLAVRNCTFTGNTAGAEGGAIQSWGDSPSLSIDNSTFTGNQSNGSAGAIDCGAASMTFRYVTISNNTSTDGKALVIYKYPLTLIDGLIAGVGNEGIGSVNAGTFSASSTNNIFSSATAPGLTNGTNSNQLGVPASQLHLGPLANNGGPTPTMALGAGSIALDAGVAITGLTTDQRGSRRPVDDPTIANASGGDASDIGAAEMNRVILSSFVSRKMHAGQGALDVTLPLSGKAGTESRTGGAPGNFELVFTFLNPLTSLGSATVTSGSANVSGTTPGSDPHQVIVDLSGVSDAQTITVALPNVMDSTGAQSDSLSVSLGVLLGDVNGDGSVNSGDATLVRSYSGQPASSANQGSIRCDVNLDGGTNSADAAVVRNHSGNSD